MGEDLDMWFRMNLKYKGAFYNKTLAYYNIDGPNRAMKRKHDYKKALCIILISIKLMRPGTMSFVYFLINLDV